MITRFVYTDEANSHTTVSQSFKTEDGFALGAWVSNQRQKKKKGSMSQEKINRLNELYFVWEPK